jgi:hypothetical protein
MKTMKAKKTFTVIDKKLEKEYKKLGFKYSRKNMYLKKTTKKFDYYIFFSSFFENVPDTYIELRVTLLINDRVLLKINKYSNSQLFNMNLWEMGNHYNIAHETLLDLFNNPVGYFTSLGKMLRILLFLSGCCLKTEVFKQLY